jgi:hypothetical protein
MSVPVPKSITMLFMAIARLSADISQRRLASAICSARAADPGGVGCMPFRRGRQLVDAVSKRGMRLKKGGIQRMCGKRAHIAAG